MKYSVKDQWHKGNYKYIVMQLKLHFLMVQDKSFFKQLKPGFATEDAIRELVNWYNSETEVHPLIKIASFVYDFLSVHPFQDGNGG
jgi:fido (protein-threonine AMPylation protein)